ncbi:MULTISPECIES: CoB--CoM heterodisulfide reductase iron-sulfur subunit B family protein [Metallosphaera]|uniref:Succinate dehydrogenase subunit C n=3 Tax=Metallosphaera TaxID=41980 RepID=A4YEJ8_METS5|nr:MULTISPECIES: CoB--CoM heterodisulfide reductase iron-sulfur subunit B family protein [Metallosphaera]ABP94850.1 succinate dehydrogenase subunit C [Metallosphaera sedula DSM 5348]AIM26837.1 succinate dehydrogenase subunit C [Metallosphaera sedula]AKV73783.1 disulfide reductase [Metallosphaera sedula]AKV76023.1 disulfide reductase [Metallosphaera sedula]AKV78274.1 disulfide reductase [Metallosphaera sedula]
MKVAYYPGCATHGLSKDVDVATKKVAEVLGLELVEVEDWNCCGGGFLDEYDQKAHAALNLRNLSQVEKMGLNKMATPCSVCLQSHRLAVNNYKEDKELRKDVDSRLKSASIEYKGTVDAEHIVWVLVRDVGIERIKSHVTRPLTQLKVGTYYGCQMLRPEQIMGFESAYKPHSLEDLVSATGATPVRFPMATACCGFPLMGSNPKGGLKLAYNVLSSAKGAGADIMVHPCSLCHLQLDVTQFKVMDEFKTGWTMPTMYVTQLLAISFGISPKELGLSKIAMKALEERGIT